MHYHIRIPDETLAEVCHRYYVRELAIFGSALRDDFREDSDLDIIVEYEPEARTTLFDHFDLTEELGQLLGRNVDLVSKGGLRPVLREEVLDFPEVLYIDKLIPRHGRAIHTRR